MSNEEEENLNITDKYFTFVKQLCEDYVKYIINYKIATGEYLKKIKINQEKYRPKLSETVDQIKNINLNHIISLTSIIPKVVEQQIINIEYFFEGIDEKLDNFEKLIKEQNLAYIDTQSTFKEIKNELIKKYKEIEKLKLSFMTNITFVEENIHKFYKKKSKSQLNLSQMDSNHELDLDQINSYIQKTKKIEDEYITNISLVKNAEKSYIDIGDESKKKSRKILCQLANSLKELISDCMQLLSNSFKLPLSEIDTYLKDLISLDEYSKFDEIIQNSYQKDNKLQPINPEKYTLKFFQQKNNNNNNSTNNGLEEMDFVQEEEIFMTIKKMMENFDLLEKNKFNLKLEEEKLRCKYLTLKILSLAPSNKLNTNNVPNITPEEVEEIDEMLTKKQNRIIFIQKLSQFRTSGNFEIPDNMYNILSRLFNKIAKMVESDEDYESAVNIIILSQTYYITKNNDKKYLQNSIMNNAFFKRKKFWEAFLNYLINKEIAEQNGKSTDNTNIAFAQLISMINNMIEFELDVNIIEEIIFPLIEKYKISPELTELIFSPLNDKKKELENANKIMIKEISSGQIDTFLKDENNIDNDI
jgi:hypothetical protein